MNKREKTLAIVLGGVLVVGVLFKLVYPNVIKPLFDYGGRLEKAKAEHDDLEEEFGELEGRLKQRYHDYVLRTGSTETAAVSDEILNRINTELSDARMEKGSTVTPRTPSVDKRTQVATLRVSVSAPGSFAQCIQFIRGVYRMPYIVRFESIKLSPIGKPQQKQDDLVKLDAEIEAMILPHEKLLGAPPGDKPQPLYSDRLANADTRQLEGWKPFIPYSPPATPKPTPGPTPTPEPTPEPPPPGAPTDPYADVFIVRGLIGYGVDEILLYNQEADRMSYVAVGDALDAGELVLAHALGAVAHKATEAKDFGYYVYPIGHSLADRIKLEDASQWPELQVAMQQYFEQRRAQGLSDPVRKTKDGPEGEEDEATQAERDSRLDELDEAVALDLAIESGFVGPPFVVRPDVAAPGAEEKKTVSADADSNGDADVPAAGEDESDIGGATAQESPQPESRSSVQGDEEDRTDSPAAAGNDNRSKDGAATRRSRSGRPVRERTPSRRSKPVERK